jgi:outer membrane biosynthesis protein TonB
MTTHSRACVRTITTLVAAVCVVALSGCVHTQAKAAPNSPPLDTPVAPPRDVTPVDMEAPAPVPLPEEPARRTPSRARPPQREVPRPEPKPEPPKPEPPAPPVEPTKAPDEPAKPPTTLQTTPAGSEGEVERSITVVLARASNDLKRIDYRGLSADARNQYDTVKSLVRQAESAMHAKNPNLVFAKTLADKAAALAAQLAPK